MPSLLHMGSSAASASRALRSRKGMTLVETMIATAIFTLGMLGVYMMLVKSYELVTFCRHRDNARAVLLSYADQFQRLRTTDSSGALNKFFQTQSIPGSFGLSWTDASNNTISNLTDTTDMQGLPIMLGDPASSGVRAHVFRQVNPLKMTDGSTLTGSPTVTAAGYMLQATFTITYDIKGRPFSQSITVARSYR